MNTLAKITLTGLIIGILTACGGLAPANFQVIAEGAAGIGKSDKPMMFALRGNDSKARIPDGLPDDARNALEQTIGKSDQGLYVVVYAGVQPSGGYRVKINSIANAGNKLIVNYTIEKPQPGQMAVTMLTYPYAIARVNDVSVQPGNVIFEGK